MSISLLLHQLHHSPLPPVQGVPILPKQFHTIGGNTKPVTVTQGSISASVQLGNTMISTKDGKAYMLITLKGNDTAPQPLKERQPMDLSIVIDRSGSMNGEKLDSVKRSLQMLASQLRTSDYISLVIYDSEVATVFKGNFDKESFLSAVSRVQSGSMTNLVGGLEEGMKNILPIFPNGRLHHVILLSDGLANVGESSPDGLAHLVEHYRLSNITVSTIGVGVDYDENIMTRVAIAGNGNYYFMERPDDAENIFAKEFDSVSNTVAKDLKVEFHLGSMQVIRGIGYELKDSIRFFPHDLTAGKSSTYIFEVQARDLQVSTQSFSPGELTIYFNDVKTSITQSIRLPLMFDGITSTEINPLSDIAVYNAFMNGYIADTLWNVDLDLQKVQNKEAKSKIDLLYQDVQQANIRTNGGYSSQITKLEEKRTFIYNQGTININSTTVGKQFKKMNQADSFGVRYSR